MRKAQIGAILLMLSLWNNANASNIDKEHDEPVVGQLCPDFHFDKSLFYTKNSFHLHELRGQWVVLDFWSRHCAGCIASFPHISEMQQKFRSKVQFLMVTFDDSAKDNHIIFTKYHEKEKLEMPCVFNGTTDTSGLFQQCKVGALPFVIIVDPVGKVRAITAYASSAQIQDLLDGKDPEFVSAFYSDGRQRAMDAKYSTVLPYLVDGNGGSSQEFEYRSLLAKWKPGAPKRCIPDFSKGKFEVMGVGVTALYSQAYLGVLSVARWGEEKKDEYSKTWPAPIVEVKDTSIFLADDLVSDKDIFCYSLIVPSLKAGKDRMMQIMRSDLNHYFGYKVMYETRQMPYWKLIVTDSILASKLRTTANDGKTTSYSPVPFFEFGLKNVSMNGFIDFLSWYSGIHSKPRPLVDETNIQTNIDILIKSPEGHLESLNEALKKYGLAIVSGIKEMKVVVIRDSNDNDKDDNDVRVAF